MKTHVLFIIDASGSMAPYVTDTIGGFHGYLDTLAADTEGTYEVTVALFSSRNFYNIHAAAQPPDSPGLRLDARSYRTVGLTALFDATGRTLTEFIDTHSELADDENVTVVSITDGEENNSNEYTADSVRSLINALKLGGKFTFVYLAQGIDGWKQAKDMGYHVNDYVGTRVVTGETISGSYSTAAEATFSSNRGMRVNTSDIARKHLAADQLRDAPQD